MRSKVIILLLLMISLRVLGQNIGERDSLTLIFMGDIMGHVPQIHAALDPKTGKYNYDGVFKELSPVIKSADFAIANLEVTLSGAPYSGYPRFSSPDALAAACKKIGIDVLVTANNHACDRKKKGILRTINVLDSLGIRHTGTFKDSSDRKKNNLLILSKNHIRVGLLNYTYGTNGMPTPKPTIVNRIDTLVMLSDIQKSRSANLDKLVAIIHWGIQYQSEPSQRQIKIARFLLKNGVDIIIGSHPHVVQKMVYTKKDGDNAEHLIAYSLGNLISDQRTSKRDGGAMLRLTLVKENNEVRIDHPGYYLTWVYKSVIHGKKVYEIIPCSIAESDNLKGINFYSRKKMKLFLTDSRALLNKENMNIKEITPSAENEQVNAGALWSNPWKPTNGLMDYISHLKF